MSEQKQKNLRITSPQGRAIFPYLTKPDTKFKDGGEYKVKLAVPAKLAEGLVKIIDDTVATALIKAKAEAKGKRVKEADLPYQMDENTDEVIFSFKMNASGKTKSGEVFTQKPALFDAKGKSVDVNVRVGGGSTLRVSAEVVPFIAPIGVGVSMRMKAVQIITLKEFGGNADAGAYGFGAEEGYESANEETFPVASDPAPAPAATGTDGSDF